MTSDLYLACVAGARKGKGEGKSGTRATRGEKENEAPAAPDFPSPFPFIAPATKANLYSGNDSTQLGIGRGR